MTISCKFLQLRKVTTVVRKLFFYVLKLIDGRLEFTKISRMRTFFCLTVSGHGFCLPAVVFDELFCPFNTMATNAWRVYFGELHMTPTPVYEISQDESEKNFALYLWSMLYGRNARGRKIGGIRASHSTWKTVVVMAGDYGILRSWSDRLGLCLSLFSFVSHNFQVPRQGGMARWPDSTGAAKVTRARQLPQVFGQWVRAGAISVCLSLGRWFSERTPLWALGLVKVLAEALR